MELVSSGSMMCHLFVLHPQSRGFLCNIEILLYLECNRPRDNKKVLWASKGFHLNEVTFAINT